MDFNPETEDESQRRRNASSTNNMDGNSYPPPPPQVTGQYPIGNSYIIPDPLIAAAGHQFLGQYSQNLVNNTGGWIDRNLRPLFAVDDSYVVKKLGFIMFPFLHRRWHGSHEQPKENVVQPDLYIPLVSFMTYVLAAGYMLGLKDKFSPEQLGILSSSAMVCLSLEVGLMVLLLNIFNVKTWFSFLHHIAFCGYKFVPIIAAMLISLIFQSSGYYATIGYTTLALGYYFMKSFHVAIESANHENFDHKTSRTGIYIIGLFCLLQPFFMFWLSYHLVP